MVGVLLTVWVRDSLLEAVRDAQASIAACGLMNYMGNKGGVAIRLRLHDSSFCFLSSHLNAHAQNVLRRNQDFAEICRRILFTPGGGGGGAGGSSSGTSSGNNSTTSSNNNLAAETGG